MARRPPLRIALLALALVLAGCSFHRTVSNRAVSELDTAFIEVGRTTWLDVLRRLGPPAATSTWEIVSRPLTQRHLRYECTESRRTALDLSYILELLFVWSDSQRIHELLIEFDDRGRVSSVHRRRRHTIRPPLEGEGSRPEAETRTLLGGGRS